MELCINSLKEHVNNFPTRYNSKFVGALKKSMQTRLNKYKEEQAYHCATFLDPRFKLEAFTSEEEADKVRLEITDLVKTSTTTQLSEDTQDISQSPTRKRSRLFDFKRHSSLTTSPQSSEVTKYLAEQTPEETDNPLQFWKTAEASFPALATLARKYLALTASSAPVERVFSISGVLITDFISVSGYIRFTQDSDSDNRIEFD